MLLQGIYISKKNLTGRLYRTFEGVESNQKTKKLVRWVSKKEESQIARINPKVLSLMELKEIMDQIFENKHQHDQNCIDNKFARDSIEQYMFFFFKKKFGLNHLVIEWMYSIAEAVKRYSSSDSEIALFAFVLRSEINEDYHKNQNQLKFQIEKCLRHFIQSENPNKHVRIINVLVIKARESKLKEDRVFEMINFMYDDNHSLKEEIMEKVKAKIEEQTMKIPNFKEKNSNQVNTKKMVKVYERGLFYEDLENVILQVHLKNWYLYLENLISLYREYDSDNYGYITIKQFIEMVSSITKEIECKVDVNDILQKRPSYDPNVLTFSDLVNLFSEYEIEIDENKQSLLEFISQSK